MTPNNQTESVEKREIIDSIQIRKIAKGCDDKSFSGLYLLEIECWSHQGRKYLGKTEVFTKQKLLDFLSSHLHS